MVKVKRKRAPGRRNTQEEERVEEEEKVPRIPADTKGPQDLEEEERVERMIGLLDCYAARKRKR